MRNFYHNFQPSNIVFIDFTGDPKDLEKISDDLANRLLAAFETVSFARMSPSEEEVMHEFLGWFNLFVKQGQAISANYPRMSNFNDLPANTAFSYINCNTGKGLLLIGEFDDGYGDVTYGGERV